MQLEYREVIKRIQHTKGFEIIEQYKDNIKIYDEIENKFLTYRNLLNFNPLSLFYFFSLNVDKEKFINIINLLDRRFFLKIERVYFINNKKELDFLLNEFPSQYIDMEKHIGVNFYNDNVIVINTYLIKKLAWEDMCLFQVPFLKTFNQIIWKTLIHELRHDLVENPIITDKEIPLSENCEEKVERYCLEVFNKIVKPRDYICFSSSSPLITK